MEFWSLLLQKNFAQTFLASSKTEGSEENVLLYLKPQIIISSNMLHRLKTRDLMYLKDSFSD